MPYQVVVNSPVSILHAVRTLDESATITGQAGAITKSLVDPGGDPSAVTVTITEIGTSGYYTAQFSPNETGNWELTLVNPAGSEQGTYRYTVQALAQASISGATARDLATLARVRERLHMAAARTEFDNLFQSLITEESNGIQDRLGRTIGEFAYVHYLDGTNQPRLWLRQGPIVQVNSVIEIEYQDAGDGSQQENEDTLEAYRYVARNLRTEGAYGCGYLERVDGGVFTAGARRWKVDYTAGFNPIPEGLVGWTIDAVVNAFFTREASLMASKDVGEATINLLTPGQMEREERRILAPYRDRGGRW